MRGRSEPVIEISDETMGETMLRLSAEIEVANRLNELARAERAQQALNRLQLARPSAACRVLIQQDCRRLTQLLQSGRNASIKDRIKATKKLGLWLRWRTGSQHVPTSMVIEGLFLALRSEPEVAWVAQCALFHATKRSDNISHSVSKGTRGTVTRFLLNQPEPFPFYLPKPNKRAVETYERAMQTDAVSDLFSRLRSLTLVDPGYGENTEGDGVTERLSSLAHVMGRNLMSLESLTVLGFEDAAMVNVLSRLSIPKSKAAPLRSLTVMGACHTASAQKAILTTLNRHAPTLVHLELNVWTEFLSDAVDPLAEIGVMPELKQLTIRAPPLWVPWEHFAECFPNLEELTFLYSQDFARNAVEVLDDCEHPAEQQELLQEHALWLYRDAVLFARDLHKRGFRRLAKQCQSLKEIRLSVIDCSNGYDVTPAEERPGLLWRRNSSPEVSQYFCRDSTTNNITRSRLKAQAELLESTSDFIYDHTWGFGDDDMEWSDSDTEADDMEAYEEVASTAGSAAMLQVVRLFDDPSLEADFGLRRQ